ncbi:hypothetical protein ANCCAN_25976 [Ancylostoma caninum]|uniref:Uncharacterized protein n=1 Tax=Ancylostoma caninum TaxID=29170 RepID=A0A368F881_ANCCA|nr:hypothetical protein ANCCAN_25976 [Ancylostoma caninum]
MDLSQDEKNQGEPVKDIYSRHFPSCYLVAFVETDRILICSKIQNNTWATNRENLKNALIEVDTEFNFNIAHIAIPLTDNLMKKS